MYGLVKMVEILKSSEKKSTRIEEICQEKNEEVAKRERKIDEVFRMKSVDEYLADLDRVERRCLEGFRKNTSIVIELEKIWRLGERDWRKNLLTITYFDENSKQEVARKRVNCKFFQSRKRLQNRVVKKIEFMEFNYRSLYSLNQVSLPDKIYFFSTKYKDFRREITKISLQIKNHKQTLIQKKAVLSAKVSKRQENLQKLSVSGMIYNEILRKIYQELSQAESLKKHLEIAKKDLISEDIKNNSLHIQLENCSKDFEKNLKNHENSLTLIDGISNEISDFLRKNLELKKEIEKKTSVKQEIEEKQKTLKNSKDQFEILEKKCEDLDKAIYFQEKYCEELEIAIEETKKERENKYKSLCERIIAKEKNEISLLTVRKAEIQKKSFQKFLPEQKPKPIYSMSKRSSAPSSIFLYSSQSPAHISSPPKIFHKKPYISPFPQDPNTPGLPPPPISKILIIILMVIIIILLF